MIRLQLEFHYIPVSGHVSAEIVYLRPSGAFDKATHLQIKLLPS
jgi:hypothetical protein